MWIRTTKGNYINLSKVTAFFLNESQYGGFSIMARPEGEKATCVAMFSTEIDAQNYLDKMMSAIGGSLFKIDMGEWNYTGHKKEHKEKRHGGS